MNIRKFGWKRQLPDQRDFKFNLQPVIIPPRIDLTETGFMPPVYDQGNLGACTANAIAAALDFDRAKQKEPWETPSRLFIYYNERDAEGSADSDSGAAIRDGIKSIVSQGACPESQWPYDVSQFSVKPPDTAYQLATKYEALLYQSLDNTNLIALKNAIAAGFPFVFGFTVYESFQSDAVEQTGIVPMPNPEEQTLGGHAVVACGYNDKVGRFIVRNSWGPNWGKGGYFSIPYAYLTNSDLASDFWVIQKVTQ